MGKEVKTNTVRIRNEIRFYRLAYRCDRFIDGIHSEATGTPVCQTWNHLSWGPKTKKYYVFVIPMPKRLIWKAAARAVSKIRRNDPCQDLTAITGYVRGLQSSWHEKKHSTVIDASARQYSEIYIAAAVSEPASGFDPQGIWHGLSALLWDILARPQKKSVPGLFPDTLFL